MKRFFTLLAAGLLILAITAPAMAWEFSMNGEYIHRLIYNSRIGNDDLFGLGNNVGFAGPNFYGNSLATADNPANNANQTGAALIVAQGGYSTWESDMLLNDQRLTLVPTIRVNNAIRVHGVYNIGGYRNAFAQHAGRLAPVAAASGVGIPPYERYYQFRTSTYVYGTSGVGSWEQVRLTVQLPICILSIGVKDFPFGTGAALANHTSGDAWFMIVPWGPFRIFFAQWLARNFGPTEGWNTNPDSGLKRDYMGSPMGFGGTYDNADLQIFWLSFYMNNHLDNAYFPAPPAFGMVPAAALASADFTLWNLGLGFKYNNGRFFANAEWGYTNTEQFRSTLRNGEAVPLFANQRYGESSYAFAEAGFLCGPAKLAAMWAYSPGLQRANGFTAGLATPNPTKVRAIAAINYQVHEAYNYLMFYTYGGGNNVFDPDGHGNIGDANVYAARADYAVASNLNVWGSYMWAERLEKDGYLAGQFVGATPGTVVGVPGIGFAAANGGTDPFAGNGFLGWELGAGVDWKLLEGMSTFVRYAYWQPGNWFTRAYQFGVRDDGVVAMFPNRTIMKDGRSAIQALYWSVVVNF